MKCDSVLSVHVLNNHLLQSVYWEQQKALGAQYNLGTRKALCAAWLPRDSIVPLMSLWTSMWLAMLPILAIQWSQFFMGILKRSHLSVFGTVKGGSYFHCRRGYDSVLFVLLSQMQRSFTPCLSVRAFDKAHSVGRTMGGQVEHYCLINFFVLASSASGLG